MHSHSGILFAEVHTLGFRNDVIILVLLWPGELSQTDHQRDGRHGAIIPRVVRSVNAGSHVVLFHRGVDGTFGALIVYINDDSMCLGLLLGRVWCFCFL